MKIFGPVFLLLLLSVPSWANVCGYLFTPSVENKSFQEQLVLAKRFASETHRYIGNIYNGRAYSHHLAQVQKVLEEFGITSNTKWGRALLLASWLHDSVEDVPFVDRQFVARMFGEDVALLVDAVTKLERGVVEGKKLREILTYKKLHLHPLATILKLADKIANVRFAISTNDLYSKHEEGFKVFFATTEAAKIFQKPSHSQLEVLEMSMWKELSRLLYVEAHAQ